MYYDDTRITRKELYEQVWTEPITKLSKRYGVSDVGLAKICSRNFIPRPPRGYWAKKQAGKDPGRNPLPQGNTDKIIEIKAHPFKVCDSQMKEVAVKEIGSKEHDRIVVPETLRKPHPLVKQSAEILRSQEPNNQGLIESSKMNCLDIQVSKKSLPRALRIMDTLIKSLEHRGYGVFLSGQSTEVRIHDVALSFGMTEQLVKKRKEPKDHELNGYYQFAHSRFYEESVPSGKLCLSIRDAVFYWGGSCQHTWRDGKSKRLEDRLNGFISGLLRAAAQKEDRCQREQEKERERREYERKREEEERLWLEKRQRIEEERQKVASLISEAENWHKSKMIRDYITAVEKLTLRSNCEIKLEDDLDGWLKWAREQADRLDPLTASPRSIIDGEAEDKHGDSKYWDVPVPFVRR
jgi:hypothetical protein